MGANNKAILIIIDGLGDLTPNSPLQTAKKKNLDRLTKEGITGMLSTIKRGIVPGSDTSHLSILGYEPEKYYCGRGPLEALGVGVQMKEGDVAFRANFATAQGNNITDRRAGRIDTTISKKLESSLNFDIEDIRCIFKSSVEHRGVLVLRGSGLSANVSETDSQKTGYSPESKPLDESKEAKKTARVVNAFTKIAREHLEAHEENRKQEKSGKPKANAILLRGAGTYKKIQPIAERFGITAACVAGGALYRGVAKYIGMTLVTVDGATGTKDTNLHEKAKEAVLALRSNDMIFLHVKACDSFGHDGDPKGKTKMIERIDAELIPLLAKSGANLIITGDHSTPCARRGHSGHEVPILIWGNERQDEVAQFDEQNCMKGGLGHVEGKDMMPIILNLIGKGKKYGS
ncbi:MAG: 2,3-bisphosphoglycerate-independent phosphoglycerate mutase [Candidatus Micrarchaeota archaeon]